MGLMYKEDLKIDQFALDECCLKQPVLFDQYAQTVASLSKYRDELKLALDQTSARLDGIIRETASVEGKKVTEAIVSNEITRNLQYADLQQKYLNTCAEVEEAKVIKEAFQQRRDMLKLLVELYISGYWASVETKIIKQKGTEGIEKRLREKMLQDKKGQE